MLILIVILKFYKYEKKKIVLQYNSSCDKIIMIYYWNLPEI